MTIRPLSQAEVRSIDARAAGEFALPTLVLMENAGRGAAERLRSRLSPESRVVIACGPGNNGGDGGVVARHLDAWGYNVHVLWFADPSLLKGDAAIQYKILTASGIPQTVATDLDPFLNDADWIVDALLGTGLTRPVEGHLLSAITSMNQSGRPILALDLPSGLDADTGLPLCDAVQATFTTTFVAPKLGFGEPGALRYTGEVEVVEIGVPRRLLAAFETSLPGME